MDDTTADFKIVLAERLNCQEMIRVWEVGKEGCVNKTFVCYSFFFFMRCLSLYQRVETGQNISGNILYLGGKNTKHICTDPTIFLLSFALLA